MNDPTPCSDIHGRYFGQLMMIQTCFDLSTLSIDQDQSETETKSSKRIIRLNSIRLSWIKSIPIWNFDKIVRIEPN